MHNEHLDHLFHLLKFILPGIALAALIIGILKINAAVLKKRKQSAIRRIENSLVLPSLQGDKPGHEKPPTS